VAVAGQALSQAERARVLEQLHGPRIVDCSPAHVYGALLAEGTSYPASERTMYRLLAAGGPVRERRDQLTHPPYAAPELLASRPNGFGRGTSRNSSGRRRAPTCTCS
jgi:putative transposase